MDAAAAAGTEREPIGAAALHERTATAEAEVRHAALRFALAAAAAERRYNVLVTVLNASDGLVPDGRAARILSSVIPADARLMRRRIGRSIMAVRRIRGKVTE